MDKFLIKDPDLANSMDVLWLHLNPDCPFKGVWPEVKVKATLLIECSLGVWDGFTIPDEDEIWFDPAMEFINLFLDRLDRTIKPLTYLNQFELVDIEGTTFVIFSKQTHP